jgi:hypothetical protein
VTSMNSTMMERSTIGSNSSSNNFNYANARGESLDLCHHPLRVDRERESFGGGSGRHLQQQSRTVSRSVGTSLSSSFPPHSPGIFSADSISRNNNTPSSK